MLKSTLANFTKLKTKIDFLPFFHFIFGIMNYTILLVIKHMLIHQGNFFYLILEIREMPLDFDKIIFAGVFQNRNTINF